MRPMRTLPCFIACVSLTCLTASAQQVVHAIEGTAVQVDPKAGTIQVTNNNGTGGSFKEESDPNNIDKELRTEVVPAGQFTAKGNKIVLLYEGYGDLRTAIAVRDLGTADVTTVRGAFLRYDKHAHVLTLKTDDGKTASFHLDATTIADTPNGAAAGVRFEASPGDHIKVATTQHDGASSVVFVGYAE